MVVCACVQQLAFFNAAKSQGVVRYRQKCCNNRYHDSPPWPFGFRHSKQSKQSNLKPTHDQHQRRKWWTYCKQNARGWNPEWNFVPWPPGHILWQTDLSPAGTSSIMGGRPQQSQTDPAVGCQRMSWSEQSNDITVQCVHSESESETCLKMSVQGLD